MEEEKESMLEEDYDIHFFQGTTDLGKKEYSEIKNDSKKYIEAVKKRIGEFFNVKNVNFLFGSGTSCPVIPNMGGLFEYIESILKEHADLKDIFNRIANKSGKNLEEILGILYSAKAYNQGYNDPQKHWANCEELTNLIEQCIFDKINVKEEANHYKEVLNTYKTFYQKLALRNKDLSRLCIFTTNNDLMNETALDSLNIHYINGFGGGVRRYFNPALFSYAFSKRMDTSIDKFEPVENMVYLYKIHGSINWIEDKNNANSYFDIREVFPPVEHDKGTVLIYPTPTKQNKSLGSPYVDLFREFQHKLLQPNSILFVIGYSFSDEHVNDIIYRALATNTTINVVIINNLGEEKPISQISDNRIFRLWSTTPEKSPLHFFCNIVDKLLPDLDAFRHQDENLQNFIDTLKNIKEQTHNENRENHIS